MPIKDPGSKDYGSRQQQRSQGRRRRHKGLASKLQPEFRRVGIRELRRATTDPFTTHVAMEQFIAFRHGLTHGEISLVRPSPDLAPRVFPGSRSLIGEPEKHLLGLDS